MKLSVAMLGILLQTVSGSLLILAADHYYLYTGKIYVQGAGGGGFFKQKFCSHAEN